MLGHFNIYTREAGAGGLSIAMEGPSKADIDFQDNKDGSCEVAYTCTEVGKKIDWFELLILYGALCLPLDHESMNLLSRQYERSHQGQVV